MPAFQVAVALQRLHGAVDASCGRRRSARPRWLRACCSAMRASSVARCWAANLLERLGLGAGLLEQRVHRADPARPSVRSARAFFLRPFPASGRRRLLDRDAGRRLAAQSSTALARGVRHRVAPSGVRGARVGAGRRRRRACARDSGIRSRRWHRRERAAAGSGRLPRTDTPASGAASTRERGWTGHRWHDPGAALAPAGSQGTPGLLERRRPRRTSRGGHPGRRPETFRTRRRTAGGDGAEGPTFARDRDASRPASAARPTALPQHVEAVLAPRARRSRAPRARSRPASVWVCSPAKNSVSATGRASIRAAPRAPTGVTA